MDIKHKITFLIGVSAVVAAASYGGIALYTREDAPLIGASGNQLAPRSEPAPSSAKSTPSTPGESAPTTTQTTPGRTQPTDTSTTPPPRQVTTPPPVATPAPTPAPVPTPAPTPVPAIYTYRNGTYTAVRSYNVPEGETNTITVIMTLQNDKVLAVSAGHNADASNKSLQYIGRFESNVCSTVCGQSLTGLSPSRISGASLTTAAFDQALDTIRTNARA